MSQPSSASPAVQSAYDLIQTYYTRFNSRDRESFLDLLTDDVVHDLNQGGREVGKANFAVFLQRMDRCYRERIVDIRVVVGADGIHAGAEYVVRGTYIAQDKDLPPAIGQTYVLPGGAFFDLRDGKIARVTNYYDLNEWLRQVGAI